MRRLLLVLAIGSLAACAVDTGDEDPDATEEDLSARAYANPILPMFMRPAGVSRQTPADDPGHPTEGCPDPAGIRTRAGDYFVYCTSYTFRYNRLDGFPIFQSRSRTLAGPWDRKGSLIPDRGTGRSSWPRWVRDTNGTRDGDFWGPDVAELPSGKFVASYSAPCGAHRCVGIAWADHPAGPWHHAQDPYIGPQNNGVGSGNSYDPNLLVTTNGELYLYWVVVNHGVFGARVQAKPSGELEPLRGSDARLIASRAKGQRGEGPYVVEHGGAFYEMYSTGSLLDGYHVGVRRGTSPLAAFDREAPEHVVDPGGRFVATGGNSVVPGPNGSEFLVYHAIVVPPGGGCPRRDPVYGGAVKRTADNPHCRVQGERQAMIDRLEWKADASGIEWPVVANGGKPSQGRVRLP